MCCTVFKGCDSNSEVKIFQFSNHVCYIVGHCCHSVQARSKYILFKARQLFHLQRLLKFEHFTSKLESHPLIGFLFTHLSLFFSRLLHRGWLQGWFWNVCRQGSSSSSIVDHCLEIIIYSKVLLVRPPRAPIESGLIIEGGWGGGLFLKT